MRPAFSWALCALIIPWHSWAYDRFSDERVPARFVIKDDRGLELVLKSQVSMAWRDLEGRGGPGFDSATDTVTLGTRSPHFALETARLALRAHLPDGISVFSAYRFGLRSGALESAWLNYDLRAGSWQLYGELGLNQPFVARDQRMGRASIAERSYWGSSEAHLTMTIERALSDLTLALGLSAAFMRPLGASPINDATGDRGIISLLSYDQHRSLSGGQPVFGSRLSLTHRLGRVALFGYIGALSADGGVDELRNRLAGFSRLPGYDPADPRAQDDTFWWTGAHVGIQRGGFELDLDGIRSADSLIRRQVWSVQAGYVWTLSGIGKDTSLALRARGERYQMEPGSTVIGFRLPDPSQALSWDHDVLTTSVEVALYRGLMRLRVEHSAIDEHTAHPQAQQQAETLDNNETTIGLDLRF